MFVRSAMKATAKIPIAAKRPPGDERLDRIEAMLKDIQKRLDK